jgi:hypothetical protein
LDIIHLNLNIFVTNIKKWEWTLKSENMYIKNW